MQINTKKTLLFYWQNILNYKLFASIIVLSTIFAAIFDTAIPVYFKNFFNILSGGQSKDSIVDGLFSVLLSITLLSLSRWFCYRISLFSINHFDSKIMADMTRQCFAYLHKHSYSYFSDNFTGSIVKKVKSFVSAFEVLTDQIFFEILPNLVSIIFITIVLSRVNIFIGLGMLLWVFSILAINYWFTKYKLKYDVERSEAETKSTGYLADTVTNSTNINLFNGFKFEIKKFYELTEKARQLRKFTWDLGATFEAIQSFLTVFLQVGLFYFAVILWQQGHLTVGDFVLIQSYILFVVMMAWHFGKVIRRIYEYLAEAEEMTVILNTPHEIADIPNAKKLRVKKGQINYKNIDFYYNPDKKIIEKLNLIIKPEETIALIGPSGAGKTTLIKLLLRLHNLQGGQISIDNQDISRVTQSSLHQNISLVPQDPILFHRSLMENIRYGNFDASDEQVIQASKLAHCHEFISQLKDGYDTFVGERGIKLSGGERQRVAIARAILRNSPILILDEATSSLDSESEELIQSALSNLMKNKTVIIIAHRLSTIKKVDRIIVIDNGQVVEEGTHRELFSKNQGVYQKLWNIQSGGFQETTPIL